MKLGRSDWHGQRLCTVRTGLGSNSRSPWTEKLLDDRKARRGHLRILCDDAVGNLLSDVEQRPHIERRRHGAPLGRRGARGAGKNSPRGTVSAHSVG